MCQIGGTFTTLTQYTDESAGSEDDELPTARPKKITERKRRQNAIADNYVQDALNDPAKKPKVLPEDEANQSTRYIVHQAESRQIISSPREYQIELFERAKEKNIIAVLDTGKVPYPLFSITQLILHRFGQNLDCCSSPQTYLRPRARG